MVRMASRVPSTFTHRKSTRRSFRTCSVRSQKHFFPAFTERSQQGRDCRRPCSIETVALIAFAPRDAAADWKPHDDQRACLREVVEIFRNGSFLRAPEDGLPGEVVDLSHESLISGWGTLQSWIESEARRVKDWVWLADMERRHREESGPLFSVGKSDGQLN